MHIDRIAVCVHGCVTMSKVILIVGIAVALIQLIKPLGWPGLKRRQDAWKLVVFGAAASVLFVAILSLVEKALA